VNRAGLQHTPEAENMHGSASPSRPCSDELRA
jgi:hypothetical protein